MVQNDDNAGEYKVFNISFDGTDEAFELSASNIQEIGTADFGADLNDSIDNGGNGGTPDPEPTPGDAILVDSDLTAVDGVAETFIYQIDSSTGDVISLAGGDWTITDFNVAEDSLVFDDVAAGTVTTETFVDAIIVSESGIFSETNIYFAEDTEGTSYELTLAGVVDGDLSTVDFTVA
jgi:hypothetical protein